MTARATHTRMQRAHGGADNWFAECCRQLAVITAPDDRGQQRSDGRFLRVLPPVKLRGERSITAILEAAGLPSGPKGKFHKLRRTIATQLCDATDELTVMKFLAHSSLQVTRAYLDPRQIRKPDAAELVRRPEVETVKD